MLARVSDKEILTPDGENFYPIHGAGTRKSDSIVMDIPPQAGIQNPIDLPAHLMKLIDKAGEGIEAVNKKYKAAPDSIQKVRGTGNITRATERLNNQNKEAEAAKYKSILQYGQQLANSRVDQKQQYEIPGYAGSKKLTLAKKITPTDAVAPLVDPSFDWNKAGDFWDYWVIDRGEYYPGSNNGRKNILFNKPWRATAVSSSKENSNNTTSTGDLSNLIVNGISGLTGLGQFLAARNQSIAAPSSYASNNFARQGLPVLSRMRDIPYTKMNAAREAAAAAQYATRNSGGMGGSGRYLQSVANSLGLQRNYANILGESNALNNQYGTSWVNAGLGVGQQDRTAWMADRAQMNEMYSRGHGARMQQEQMGLYNINQALQNYYANKNKYDMFGRIMSNYDSNYDRYRYIA